MTEKSLTASRIATCLKQARTSITRSACSLMISIVSRAWLLLVLCALLPWLALDFIPKRKSKPLTSPARHRRLLPIPVNRAGDIYVVMPDDSEVLLEPLQASRQAQLWAEACCGAYVYEKTKLPDR